MWILLVLLYGVIKGARDVIKKKALQTNSVMEVLFVYTFYTFLFSVLYNFVLSKFSGATVATETPHNPFGLTPLPFEYYFLIAIKSLAIFIAWICSFKAIDNVPISIYGVVDLTRIIFSTLFGLFILNETTTIYQNIGLGIILFGLLFLKIYPTIQSRIKSKTYVKEDIKPAFIVMIFISCIFNALSGCLDKIYLRDIGSKELQFWYMLYLTIFYGIYLLIKKIKVTKTVWTNKYIWILSFIFFIGDLALFIANEDPASKVTVMTLIKQSACIVSIMCGKFVFKEKNIAYKMISAMIILGGIVISVIS